MNRAGWGLAAGLVLVLGVPVAPGAWANGPPVASDVQVKAAYLLNFAKYVTWPEGSFAGPESPIVIAVCGRDPFGEVLDRTVAGRRPQGRPVEVRRLSAPADLGPAHLVFLAPSDPGDLAAWLEGLGDRPLVTVGDDPAFLRVGGVIRFLIVEQSVRFEIDLDAAEAAGVSVSARMLSAAHRVVSKRREEERRGGR